MSNDAVKQALLIARHELTTLHGLIVTDNTKSDVSWVVDTNDSLRLLDIALSELGCKRNHHPICSKGLRRVRGTGN